MLLSKSVQRPINFKWTLQWRHNGRDGVSNHQPHHYFSTVYWGAYRRKHQRSASLAFCAGNAPVTGEFPAQKASIVENVSIWWRHHDISLRTSPHRTRIPKGDITEENYTFLFGVGCEYMYIDFTVFAFCFRCFMFSYDNLIFWRGIFVSHLPFELQCGIPYPQ